MGTISVNKLGGLSLIVGPVLAVLCYLIRPGGGLVGGNVDPADGAAAVGALMANSGMASVSFSLLILGLLILLYGVNVLVGSLKGGNGEAVAQYGLLFLFFGMIGWVSSAALSQVISGGNAGAAAGAVYAISLGTSMTADVLGSLGILALALAVSTSGAFNKNLALLVALVSAVLVVCGVLAGNDLSLLQTVSLIGGIGYIITTIWTITLGLALMKKG